MVNGGRTDAPQNLVGRKLRVGSSPTAGRRIAPVHGEEDPADAAPSMKPALC